MILLSLRVTRRFFTVQINLTANDENINRMINIVRESSKGAKEHKAAVAMAARRASFWKKQPGRDFFPGNRRARKAAGGTQGGLAGFLTNLFGSFPDLPALRGPKKDRGCSDQLVIRRYISAIFAGRASTSLTKI
jgi:hypothetical protein